jgi:hypothetical protein
MKRAFFVCLFQCLTTTLMLSQSIPVRPMNQVGTDAPSNAPFHTLTYLDYYACTEPTAISQGGYITGSTDWGCDLYPPALFVYPVFGDPLMFNCGPDCPSSSGTGIADDPFGNVFVVGYNIPPPGSDFMKITPPATILNVGGDGYFAVATDSVGAVYLLGGGATITKLNPQLATVYSISLPIAVPQAIVVDSAGNAYITGTAGPGLPTTAGAIQPTGSGAFVAKLNATGTGWLYVTYLTGNIGGNHGYGIAADGSGNAYVDGDGGFVTKINPLGTAVVYSTRIAGTNGVTTASGIGVDGYGGAYITGITSATDFPLVGPTQANYGGGIRCWHY